MEVVQQQFLAFMQRNVSTSLFAQASVLRDMFIVKNNTSRLLFVCFYPHVARVCSSNSPAPFQASQYPNGGVLKTRSKRVRLSPGHAHFWRWKRNQYLTFANRTVPHPAVETRHETPERVSENSSYTPPPLIGRQNRHFRATLG